MLKHHMEDWIIPFFRFAKSDQKKCITYEIGCMMLISSVMKTEDKYHEFYK